MDDKEGTEPEADTEPQNPLKLSPTETRGVGKQSTPGQLEAPQNSSGNSCYLISSSEVFYSRHSPALDFAQLPAELHLRRKR